MWSCYMNYTIQKMAFQVSGKHLALMSSLHKPPFSATPGIKGVELKDVHAIIQISGRK